MSMGLNNRFLFLFLCFFGIILCTGWLPAQDYEPVLLEIIDDAPAWMLEQYYFNDATISRIIQSKTVVYGLHGKIGTVQYDKNLSYDAMVMYENTEYIVPCILLAPVHTNNNFPDDWILDLNDENRKRWVITYYLDVFSSQKRDTILKYENDWIQAQTDDYNEQIERGSLSPWWNQASVEESLFFFPASISLGSISPKSFWVIKRKKINDSFHLTVQGDLTYVRGEERQLQSSIFNLPFPKYSERKQFTLLIIPDGDYMDVYLDTMKTKLASFAKVDASFLPELNKLIETNTCNPGNLTFWPRRADGSMDYPPPKAATNVRFTPTPQEIATYPYATTSNLRLRSSATTSANIVTTIKQGTRLTVVSKGAEATIDGITAPWVQVITETGETGWCFGGYLDPRP